MCDDNHILMNSTHNECMSVDAKIYQDKQKQIFLTKSNFTWKLHKDDVQQCFLS